MRSHIPRGRTVSETELIQQETAVPVLAVKALSAAHRRARASGRPVVLVVGGKLVRIDSQGETVLKNLPPRAKVTVRTKQATP